MLSRIVYRIVWVITTAVARLLGGLRVEGRERIPTQGGVILAANHLSYLDPLVIGVAAPKPIWVVAKEALFRVKWLAPLMRALRAFPVRPETMDRAALRQSDEILKAGGMLLIFPEGGCSRTGELLPFRAGMALMALRSGASIVPTAIVGTGDALPPDVYRLRRVPGGLVVRFGPPIDPADLPPGLERKEQMEMLTERVEAAVRRLIEPAAETPEPVPNS